MIALDEITGTLGGSFTGGRTSALVHCPCHDDSTPSLHVTMTADGKLLWYCQAGCAQDDVREALIDRGLYSTSRTEKQMNTKEWAFKRWLDKVEAEEQEDRKFRLAYSILYTAGMYRAGMYRREAKDRLAAYFNGRGIGQVPENALWLPAEEVANLADTMPKLGWREMRDCQAMVLPIVNSEHLLGTHVTFLTPDGRTNHRNDKGNVRRTHGSQKGGWIQLGALDPERPLIVAEGVETALSASQLTGFPAIAVLSAVNYVSVWPPKLPELVIAADRDEAGEKQAENAAASWAAKGRTVRIAFPPEGYNDWNDALRDPKADREQLRALLLTGQVPTSAPEPRALTIQEVLDLDIPPLEYIVEPWLETSNIAMIVALPGVGKTRFGMAVGYAIATGPGNFLAWNIPKARQVLYVDGELPAATIKRRVRLLGDSTTKNFHIVSRDLLLREGLDIPDLGKLEGRNFLDRMIERYQIEVMFLDSLSTLIHSHGTGKNASENAAESWTEIQRWLMRHRFYSRTIAFIHHEGRSGLPRMLGRALIAADEELMKEFGQQVVEATGEEQRAA
jgi:putative DNA primase/helicase